MLSNELLIKYYENIENCDKEYISNELYEYFRDAMINLLEKNNFEGIDASLEESLFYYGVICCKNNNTVIMHEDNKFQVLEIEANEINDALEDIEDGFFKWQGIKRIDYTPFITHNTSDKARAIYDLYNYGNNEISDIIGNYFNLELHELIDVINNMNKNNDNN